MSTSGKTEIHFFGGQHNRFIVRGVAPDELPKTVHLPDHRTRNGKIPYDLELHWKQNLGNRVQIYAFYIARESERPNQTINEDLM